MKGNIDKWIKEIEEEKARLKMKLDSQFNELIKDQLLG